MSDPRTTYRTREEVQRMRCTQEAKAEVDAAVEAAKAGLEPELKDLWTDIYHKGTEPPQWEDERRRWVFLFWFRTF